MTIGERIREARKRAGMTQSDLADVIGASVMTIRRYEGNERIQRDSVLRDIAKALYVEFESLHGIQPKPKTRLEILKKSKADFLAVALVPFDIRDAMTEWYDREIEHAEAAEGWKKLQEANNGR